MAEERPPVWVGHLVHGASDLTRAADFWRAIGMREVEINDNVAIFELRDGTHLILVPTDPPPARGTGVAFDLMVEDLDATHRAWTALGLAPSEIEKGRTHRGFQVTDPDGGILSVSDSHVVGVV